MSKARIDVPDELKDFLVFSHCDDFPVDTYYITPAQLEIFQAIVDNRAVAREMRKLGMSYMNSTLLYGPPGTGKTTMVKWIAHKLDMDYAYLDFSQLISGGIFGSTARNLKAIFDFMKDKDCIFLLDEIDCIAVKRGEESQATGGELSRITISLMQQMDSYRNTGADTILIGCTNRADRLDAALLSRFSITKEVPRLTNDQKFEYICQFLDAKNISYEEANIKDYCAKTAIVPNRNIESDMERCAVQWIKNGKEKYYLERIEAANV